MWGKVPKGGLNDFFFFLISFKRLGPVLEWPISAKILISGSKIFHKKPSKKSMHPPFRVMVYLCCLRVWFIFYECLYCVGGWLGCGQKWLFKSYLQASPGTLPRNTKKRTEAQTKGLQGECGGRGGVRLVALEWLEVPHLAFVAFIWFIYHIIMFSSVSLWEMCVHYFPSTSFPFWFSKYRHEIAWWLRKNTE